MQHFNPSSPLMSRLSRRSASSSGGGGWLVLGLIGALILANSQGGGLEGKIAYMKEIDDGSLQIHITDVNFNESVPITSIFFPVSEPDWSPDGTQLIFTSWGERADDEVFRVNEDGSNLTNLTNDFAYDAGGRYMPMCPPELDPCEQWIVFHSDRGGNYDLYLMNLETQAVEQLTFDPAEDRWAQFSPDGRKVVFMSDRANGSWDIFALDLFSGEMFQYTDSPLANDYFPAWSPDGLTIAWSSGDGLNYRIYLMDAVCGEICGENPRLLLPQFDANSELLVEELDAAFSPTGEWMIFASNRDLADGVDPMFPVQSDYEIFRVRLDGSDLTQLTDNEVHDLTPDWFGEP